MKTGVISVKKPRFHEKSAIFWDFRKIFAFPKRFPSDFFVLFSLWETTFAAPILHMAYGVRSSNPVETAEFEEMFSKGCGKMFENVENRNFVRNLRKKERDLTALSAKSKGNPGRKTAETEVCPHIHKSFQQLVENRFGNSPLFEQVKYGYPKPFEKSCGKP